MTLLIVETVEDDDGRALVFAHEEGGGRRVALHVPKDVGVLMRTMLASGEIVVDVPPPRPGDFADQTGSGPAPLKN